MIKLLLRQVQDLGAIATAVSTESDEVSLAPFLHKIWSGVASRAEGILSVTGFMDKCLLIQSSS